MKKFKNTKILITGGFGFIGKSLIKKIASYVKQIFIIDNLSFSKLDESILKIKNVLFIKGDVRDKKVYKKISSVDFVYHLGAPSSIVLFNENPKECIDITINGFLRVLEFSLENKVKKFIFPSSGSVYGASDYPFNEKIENPHPINIYGKTKLATEFIAKIYKDKIPMIGLRIFAGFGPEENHKDNFASIPTLFLNDVVKNNRPIIYGDGRQKRDFVWIDDIIDALIYVSFNDLTGVLNVGSGISISFNEVLKLINKALHKRIKPKYIDKPINYLENTRSNIALFKKVIGRKPADPRIKVYEYARLFASKSKFLK